MDDSASVQRNDRDIPLLQILKLLSVNAKDLDQYRSLIINAVSSGVKSILGESVYNGIKDFIPSVVDVFIYVTKTFQRSLFQSSDSAGNGSSRRSLTMDRNFLLDILTNVGYA